MKHLVQPVILCGGSGSRLWPLSTPETPKQFLSLTSDKSMIEETANRFVNNTEPGLIFGPVLVVGSKRHKDLLHKTLPDAKQILEPFGRNSAPAIAAACIAYAPEDLILILPADHDIQDVPAFHRAIAAAVTAAEAGSIVTFGIEPNHPATGYGYIKAGEEFDGGTLTVDQFVEKPDLETAKSYLDNGSYYWNAGIFLFKARTMLDALQSFAPDALACVQRAMGNADGNTIALDPEAFGATPSISIDYAVMEKANNVKTVPVSMGWSDVGGYRALHELLTNDAEANYASGPVHLHKSSGSYVRSEGPAIFVNGVSDLVIIATKDEVMITPKDDDGAVKVLGAASHGGLNLQRLSPELSKTTKDWLWEAFDTWSKVGWDFEHGGFVEQLHMDGTPDAMAARRVRVQARQVYSFSKALEMGWPNRRIAEDLIEKGLVHINTRLRHSDGGFVHKVAADGTPLNEQRDLYDHAFMILAGSAAYKATGSELALKIARDALAFIDAEMKCTAHGGWLKSVPNTMPRCSNPHMHLLEAMLEYHDATGDETALHRAREIVTLFECHFFNPANDVMAEFFTEDWQLTTPAREAVFEPGHHYEWATLLLMFERVTGHDTLSWRRRLIGLADAIGLNPRTGLPYNALRASGTITDDSSRLWPCMEMIRAYFLHISDTSILDVERLLKKVMKVYLNPGPKGGWLDEVNANGKPTAGAVPASMLYHAVTMFQGITDT